MNQTAVRKTYRMHADSTENQPLSNESQHSTEITALPFILPLIVFLVLGMFAPSFETETDAYTAERNNAKALYYTLFVMGQVVIGFSLLTYFRKIYFAQFPLRISLFWSLLVGTVGCALWVAIAKLGVEHSLLSSLGLESWMPKRVGFNPNQLESTGQRYLFIGFRFLLLAGLVPIIEELLLRGWLIRWVDNEEFWKINLAQLSFKACAVATLYGVLTHPGEILAAIVWFSLVTILMKRTGNFWDCVAVHSITNFLLGVWIMYSGDWFLW